MDADINKMPSIANYKPHHRNEKLPKYFKHYPVLSLMSEQLTLRARKAEFLCKLPPAIPNGQMPR